MKIGVNGISIHRYFKSKHINPWYALISIYHIFSNLIYPLTEKKCQSPKISINHTYLKV